MKADYTSRQIQAESVGSQTAQTATARRGFISGQTFAIREVLYTPVGGRAIFEGDVILGSVAELDSTVAQADSVATLPQEAVVRTGTEFRWPDGVIPFEVDPRLASPARVSSA